MSKRDLKTRLRTIIRHKKYINIATQITILRIETKLNQTIQDELRNQEEELRKRTQNLLNQFLELQVEKQQQIQQLPQQQQQPQHHELFQQQQPQQQNQTQTPQSIQKQDRTNQEQNRKTFLEFLQNRQHLTSIPSQEINSFLQLKQQQQQQQQNQPTTTTVIVTTYLATTTTTAVTTTVTTSTTTTMMPATTTGAAGTTTVVISDSNLNPQSWSNAPNELDAKSFWTYLTRWAKFKHITDEALLDYLPLIFKNQVLDWFENLPEDGKDTLNKVKEAFEARFFPTDFIKFSYLTEIWQRSQQPTESVEQFITHMQKIAKMGGITNEETLRFAVIKGLRDSIRRYVLQANPNTIAELTKAAKIAEQADKMSGVQLDSRTCTMSTQQLNIESSTSKISFTNGYQRTKNILQARR